MHPWKRSHAAIDSSSSSRSSSPEPPDVGHISQLPAMMIGPTLSVEGQRASNVWRAMNTSDVRGNNDCGIQSMAGVLGVTPSTLLRTAFGGNDGHARQFWQHVNERQMNGDQFAALASAVGAEVSHVSHSSQIRPPQPGQAGVYVFGHDGGAHAVCLARSDDGRVLYKVDFQQQQCQAYRIERGGEVEAGRAAVTAIMQAGGVANPFRAFQRPRADRSLERG